VTQNAVLAGALFLSIQNVMYDRMTRIIEVPTYVFDKNPDLLEK
jgi:hypothetical protein